jgi:acylphosphatase
MPSAKRVIYTGRVQGVGFRYSAKQVASGFDVTGWIKNLDDGTVEMQVMASDPDELDAFLADILESSLGSLIKDSEVSIIPPLVGVRGFTIVR